MVRPRESKLQKVLISDIFQNYGKELNSALFIPGRVDGISLCVEFMYHWFLNKFGGEEKEYFKAINLDGADPASYLKKWTKKDWLRRLKPKLSIIPKADIQFNRDYVDDDYNDIMSYINRHRGHENFFTDDRNGIKIGLLSRLNKIDFTFKIIVEEKPEQLDLYDHIFMSCRVGKTITLYTSVDFLVPDKLIKRIVEDMHFEADEEGMPKDYTAFLEYMNSNSSLTFLYKARGVNHKFEFFVRIDNIMVHIRDIELDLDDGETEGMLRLNYGLEMNCSVRFPSPKLFVLFSYDQFDCMVYRDSLEREITITDLVVTPIPTRNINGWKILLDGEFMNDNDNEPLNVSLYDMFKSDNHPNNILDTIKYCKNRKISPEVFMEIKVFNNLKEQDIYIDWEKMLLVTRAPVILRKSTIVVYTDNVFIHNAISEMRGYYKERIHHK